jgi:hypothetical protein
LGTTYFVEGGFSDPYLYIKYNEVVYVFKNNFEAAMKYSPLVKPISEYNALVNGENLTTSSSAIPRPDPVPEHLRALPQRRRRLV